MINICLLNTSTFNLSIDLFIRKELKKEYSRLEDKEINAIFSSFTTNKTIFKTNIFIISNDLEYIGFAILLFEKTLRYFYLDYLHIVKQYQNRKLGSKLYSYIRDFAKKFDSKGIYIDVYSNIKNFWSKEEIVINNSRLNFYKKFDTYIISKIGYELMPNSAIKSTFMIVDLIEKSIDITKIDLRNIFKSILINRYGNIQPKENVDYVLNNIDKNEISLENMKSIEFED